MPFILLYSLFSAALVSGYSFSFTTPPRQCADLSLQISGSGEPPYNVLIIPYGPTPLPNNVEVRTIVYQQFPDSNTSISFQLKFPANSQFVAVVSDKSGFGSGGTSVAATVLNTTDTSCFNASNTVLPDFYYNINPPNQAVQCSPSRLWWNASQVQGTPTFQGVIPGGESFSIPVNNITNATDMGTGFQWIPTVRAGSTLLVVSGDDRGLGTGGSDTFTVSAGLNQNSSCLTDTSPSSTAGPPAGGSAGLNQNSSCLTDTSPSSTAGPPAGGSYPTNASGGWTTGSTSSSTNTGAIVGGVIGGLAAIVILALVAFYVIRRRTGSRSQKERPVNLIQGDPEDDNDDPLSNYQPPPYLRPDPYLVTAPTISSSMSAREDGQRYSAVLTDSPSSAWRQSRLTSFSDPSSATHEQDGRALSPGSTTAPTSSRKSGMTRQLRAVNIIQHEDAGPSTAQEDEAAQPETIELPPAYTHIRKAEP